jgi:Holliday junction resolvase-like predicted endonuclease
VDRRLRRGGWEILGRNARVGGVEIDIIARRRNRVVFWEVKHRWHTAFPALGTRQHARIVRAAEAYATRHRTGAVDVGLAIVSGRSWWPRITLDDTYGSLLRGGESA